MEFNQQKAFENTSKLILKEIEFRKNGLNVSVDVKKQRKDILKQVQDKNLVNEGSSDILQEDLLKILNSEIDKVEENIVKHTLEKGINTKEVETLKAQIYELHYRISALLSIDPRKDIDIATTQAIVDSFLGTKKYKLIASYLVKLENLYKKIDSFVEKDEEHTKNIQKLLNLTEAFDQSKRVNSKELQLSRLN